MNIQTPPREPDSWIRDQSPDPSLFFSSPANAELLRQIQGLVENSNDICLLTGAQGAGKTTLLYRLQSGAPDHWLLCRVDCNPMMHPDQLLNRVARCIGIHPEDDGIAEAVGLGLTKLRLQGRLPVILLDDAEQLPISALMTLWRLHEKQAESVPVCALILLALPSIDRTLASDQFRAMGTARLVRLEIPLLSAAQTVDYARHFLRNEGVNVDLRLDAEQLAEIHKDSCGLPGKLNDLVIRALRDSAARKRPSLTAQLTRKIRDIPPLTATAAAIITAVLVFSGLFETQNDSSFTDTEPGQNRLPTTAPSVHSTMPMEAGKAAVPTAGKSLIAQPLPLPPQGDTSPTEAKDRRVRTVEDQETATVSHATAQDPALFEPPKKPIPGAPAKAGPRSAQSPTKVPPPKAPAPMRISRAETQPTTAGVAKPRKKRQGWLLKQDPNAYTLQILAGGSETAIQNFLRQKGRHKEVYYFQSQRKGQPWFAVLHGIYKDRKSAISALQWLPRSLRNTGAWPRSLRSIQQEIRKAR